MLDPKTVRRHHTEAEMESIVRHGSPVPAHLRQVIGEEVRLNIPLHSCRTVAQASQTLRTLARELERIHAFGGSTASVLLEVKAVAMTARRELAGRG